MTRNQWIVQWREKRIKERALWSGRSLSIERASVEALKELYNYIYLPEQEVVLTLVGRYKNKLSAEYLRKHTELRKKWDPEAIERSAELFRGLIWNKNPFLSMIPKQDEFSGKYLPVPIKYPSE